MNTTEQIQKDIQRLIVDAKVLMSDAGALGSDEAKQLHERGMSMLNRAIDQLGRMETMAVDQVKEISQKTDLFVHEKPWVAIGIATVLGALIGMVIERRR